MKKRILGLMLLGIMMSAHPSQAAFGGFRIGGNFGVMVLQGRHWYTANPSVPATDMVRRLNPIGAIYGGHAGYLFELGSSKIVVGGEAYLLMPTVNPKIDLALVGGPVEGNVSIQHKQSMGAALTVGMMFNPKILVYVNAGMELAKFQFTYQFQQPIAGVVPNLPAKQVLRHTFKPINVGLGAAYKVGPHFLAGLEISSPFFKRFKAQMTGPRAYHYKPVERRVTVKLSYLF
jgi:opacity protein-like surface antigen